MTNNTDTSGAQHGMILQRENWAQSMRLPWISRLTIIRGGEVMNSEEVEDRACLNAKVLAVTKYCSGWKTCLSWIWETGDKSVPGVLAPEFASSAKGKAIIKGVKAWLMSELSGGIPRFPGMIFRCQLSKERRVILWGEKTICFF